MASADVWAGASVALPSVASDQRKTGLKGGGAVVAVAAGVIGAGMSRRPSMAGADMSIPCQHRRAVTDQWARYWTEPERDQPVDDGHRRHGNRSDEACLVLDSPARPFYQSSGAGPGPGRGSRPDRPGHYRAREEERSLCRVPRGPARPICPGFPAEPRMITSSVWKSHMGSHPI